MVIVTNTSDLPHVIDLSTRHLVASRLQQIGSAATSSIEYIVVEPDDCASAIEQAAGFPILRSLFDGLPFNHPDFYPCTEILEEHQYGQHRIYEMVFIGNDDGAATAIFIPDTEGIDADLLALCRSWATPAVSTQ